MNLNPLKKYKERKINEAITRMEQDENYKFLAAQYTESHKKTALVGINKDSQRKFISTQNQNIFKRSIADYVKHHYKILYKRFRKEDFIEKYTNWKYENINQG